MNYLALPGVSGSYVDTPDTAGNSITGDLDLRACIAANDFSPATSQAIIAKFSSSTTLSYLFRLAGSNADKLQFSWATTGASAAAVTATSSVGVYTNGAADLSYLWVRVTIDVDNGAAGRTVRFYTSTDDPSTDPANVTWTQLGTDQVSATATSLFDSTSPVELGSQAAGTAQLFAGKIAYAEVRNGIGGTIVHAVDFRSVALGSTSTTDTGGATWTLHGNANMQPDSVRQATVENRVTAATSIVGTFPGAAVAGNLLIAFGSARGTAAPGTPAGWSAVTGTPFQVGAGEWVFMFYKVAAGGETSVTVSWTGSATASIYVTERTGHRSSQSAVLETQSTKATTGTTTTTQTTTAVTPAASNDTVVVGFATNGAAGTWSNAWNNSYRRIGFPAATSNGEVGELITPTGGSSTSTTESWTTGSAVGSIVAVFKPALSATVGQATGTNAAQPVTPLRTRAIGQPTGTNAGQQVTPRRTRSIGQPTGTNTAQPTTPLRSRAITEPTGTNTAQPITPLRVRAIAQPTSANTAQPITPLRSRLTGQATEADTAQAIRPLRARATGQIGETDTAQAITPLRVHVIAQPLEADVAQVVTPQQTTTGRSILFGQAVESDAALAVVAGRVRAIGQAVGADAASAFAVLRTRLIGEVLESDTAAAGRAVRVRPLAQPAETDSSQTVVYRRAVQIGQGTEAATGRPLAHRKVTSLGQALDAESTMAVRPNRAEVFGLAAETDAATVLKRLRARTLGRAVEVELAEPFSVPMTFTVGTAALGWQFSSVELGWQVGAGQVGWQVKAEVAGWRLGLVEAEAP